MLNLKEQYKVVDIFIVPNCPIWSREQLAKDLGYNIYYGWGLDTYYKQPKKIAKVVAHAYWYSIVSVLANHNNTPMTKVAICEEATRLNCTKYDSNRDSFKLLEKNKLIVRIGKGNATKYAATEKGLEYFRNAVDNEEEMIAKAEEMTKFKTKNELQKHLVHQQRVKLLKKVVRM